MTPDVAVVIPLNNPAGPEGDTVTKPYPLLSPKSYIWRGLGSYPITVSNPFAKMKWVYSITHPHSDVHCTHPHPHHTPLVNGLQHLYARNWTPVGH